VCGLEPVTPRCYGNRQTLLWATRSRHRRRSRWRRFVLAKKFPPNLVGLPRHDDSTVRKQHDAIEQRSVCDDRYLILPTLRSSVQGFLRRQSQKNAEHVAADCLIELVRNRSCRQQVLRGSRCLLHTGARETCFVIVNRPGLTRSQRKVPSAITNALQPWLRRPRLVYGLDAIENLAEIALRDLKIIVVLRIEPKLCRCGNCRGEPKRSISSDPSLFAGNPLDACARRAAGLGKSARRHFQWN
jgi:hypothetical protein